ncbi:UDP-2,4-diacetamido-2,4,6-trideoxy-beta-L-altropyranose hydrolase [Solemya pervernicosa gill symbiont]|uniref:UDP-2,4-diacetamido-2,4, 6-trideoxy-beta-L-altropyranose hydrolase n=1 Tax=Solemya pervernicosa gill symbiont TaxID=642797 RepID=A0A1T2L9R4_9GAMM|nr:UDP-2,4-diacetamido-2,4,6-trideoxy-beta-L-altropyranose hydrolase [Solemya pervernicosa gill symbiont]OOZ41831.1 UDP-2,4-diacetamido-2,4,6-trideoxy-beta-L-altropyranose hydrolase [Solemya pervernicosa gill symbiont]
MRRLIVRTDATDAVGLGHLTRSLALAGEARSIGCEVLGVGCLESDASRRAVDNVVDEWIDLPDREASHDSLTMLKLLIAERNPSWVVVDGYDFGYDYLCSVQSESKLLVIDDGARLENYCADLLLDQNVGAERRNYRLQGGGRVLLGAKYALLRAQFKGGAKVRTASLKARSQRVLVSLGGLSETGELLLVLQGLAQMSTPLDITCLTGASSETQATIEKGVVSIFSGRPHNLKLVPYRDEMASLMVWADVAVSAAGSICLEMACKGLPMLLMVLADNQAPIAAEFDRLGAGISLGWLDNDTPDRVTRVLTELLMDQQRLSLMGGGGLNYVDGAGASRVVKEMMGE